MHELAGSPSSPRRWLLHTRTGSVKEVHVVVKCHHHDLAMAGGIDVLQLRRACVESEGDRLAGADEEGAICSLNQVLRVEHLHAHRAGPARSGASRAGPGPGPGPAESMQQRRATPAQWGQEGGLTRDSRQEAQLLHPGSWFTPCQSPRFAPGPHTPHASRVLPAPSRWHLG